MTEVTQLGHDFSLELDSGGGWGSETFVVVKPKSVSPDFGNEEVDVTRRGVGAMQVRPGLQKFEAKVSIHYRKDDSTGALETYLAQLRTACLNKTTELVAIADGPTATSGTVYIKGEMYVIGFTQTQDINGDALVEFTLKNGDTANDPVSVTTA